MELMRRRAGCSGKNRKLPRTCLVPDPAVLVFVCWPTSAPNSSAAWPPAPLPNRTRIVPRSSCVSPSVRPTARSRTPWIWPYAPSSCGATASPTSAWTASKTVQSAHRHANTTPTSRLDSWCWRARNRPRLIRREPGRPTGVSTTWRSTWPPIPSSAWVIPARAPSASSSSGTRFAWTVFDTWMNDRDPEFATKAVAVIELLLSPPTDGPLFCVDEKPGIGVRQPTAPDQPPVPRRPPARARPARREFEYKRNGTVDLLAGFRVNDGQVCGMVRLKHRSREFCELLALLDEQTPVGQPIHLILDPVSSHWSAEVVTWLDAHPQRTFVFHFLPVHASWLSFIELYFSIIQRKVLTPNDCTTRHELMERIIAFGKRYSALDKPFAWTFTRQDLERRLRDPLLQPELITPRAKAA